MRALSFAQRGELLKAMSKVLRENRDELLELSRRCNGTTAGDGAFDVDGASGTLAFYGGLGKSLGERTFLTEGDGIQLAKTEAFWGQHLLVPRQGVAVHVNAFNFPAWGFAEKAACALLAGMPVSDQAGDRHRPPRRALRRADRRRRHPAAGRLPAALRRRRRPAGSPRPAGRARLHRQRRHRPHLAQPSERAGRRPAGQHRGRQPERRGARRPTS